MPSDFVMLARPHLEQVLERGEKLRGVLAANWQKTFSGSLYAIGVTDRRLLLQPLNRRIQPKGELRSLVPGDVADADLEGADAGWPSAPAIVTGALALTLKLRTREGETLKLMMMRGGTGLFGGEEQNEGVVALAEWLAAARVAPG